MQRSWETRIRKVDRRNCRDSKDCPLGNYCLQHDIVYRATVSTHTSEREYRGSTNEFKPRFRNHVKPFNKYCYRNDTELSAYVWTKKRTNENVRIDWSVMARAKSYQSGIRTCALCLTEKAAILDGSRLLGEKIINTRIDLGRICSHRVRAKLTYATGVKWSEGVRVSLAGQTPKYCLLKTAPSIGMNPWLSI